MVDPVLFVGVWQKSIETNNGSREYLIHREQASNTAIQNID